MVNVSKYNIPYMDPTACAWVRKDEFHFLLRKDLKDFSHFEWRRSFGMAGQNLLLMEEILHQLIW